MWAVPAGAAQLVSGFKLDVAGDTSAPQGAASTRAVSAADAALFATFVPLLRGAPSDPAGTQAPFAFRYQWEVSGADGVAVAPGPVWCVS